MSLSPCPMWEIQKELLKPDWLSFRHFSHLGSELVVRRFSLSSLYKSVFEIKKKGKMFQYIN